MLPTASYRRHFPRTLIDFHSGVVSVSLTVSSRILGSLSQIIGAICKRVDALQSATYLDIIEDAIGPRMFLYLSEAAVTVQVAYLFAMLCVMRRGVPHQDLELLRNNLFFLETIESNMPHVLRWYQEIKSLNLWARFTEFKDVFTNGPSILGRTPAEASRRHLEELAQGLWRHPPAVGKVRLHFFRTHYTGRDPSKRDPFQHPDVRIDLDFDSKDGINLGKARKLLGVERLSVITDLSPHRTTFDSVDRDKLSPVAVYDLSKQLREPIRVFEPSPSNITNTKRKMHDIVSLSVYLVYTLVRTCLGFRLHDRAYVAVTFGDGFAAKCTQLSQWTLPLNLWAREGAWLIAQLSASLVLLPLVTFFKVAVFVQSSLSFAARRSLALFLYLIVIVGDIFLFLFRLPVKTLVIVVALTWITFADIVFSTSNS